MNILFEQVSCVVMLMLGAYALLARKRLAQETVRKRRFRPDQQPFVETLLLVVGLLLVIYPVLYFLRIIRFQ